MQHPENKYHLKELHQEIDFLDRKIAHFQNIEKFDSETERLGAVSKLLTKRGTLVKVALELAGKGIEFNASELPRSLRAQ